MTLNEQRKVWRFVSAFFREHGEIPSAESIAVMFCIPVEVAEAYMDRITGKNTVRSNR